MNIDNIQALGNLLRTYYSDLSYIRNFQRHKIGKISSSEYLKKSNGTFQSFLNEFRVARNIDKTKYTDWSKRNDIKAELKVDLIILLAESDYPPVDRDEVYKEIFEQAENFKKYNL